MPSWTAQVVINRTFKLILLHVVVYTDMLHVGFKGRTLTNIS